MWFGQFFGGYTEFIPENVRYSCVDIGGPGWLTMEQFINGIQSINPKYTAEDTNLGRRIIIIYEPALT